LRAGSRIALTKKRDKYERDFSESAYNEKHVYKKTLVSRIDKREMVLIPEGYFTFGSNNGDRDEVPEQKVFLSNYYIDKYEVSNREYKIFMVMTSSKPPLSWKRGMYDPETGDYPVLVTYYEAKAYAAWAGKRLPTEEEWEKAARGGADVKKNDVIIYPWGNRFFPEKVNSIELWSDDKLCKDIKDRFDRHTASPLPVTVFKSSGASPYGVVNMSGNVMEWTSSWYMPYKKSKRKNRRYGKQYKVVRGGAWFSTMHKVRVSNREIGGMPSLFRDNIAGFRCIRDTVEMDLSNKSD